MKTDLQDTGERMIPEFHRGRNIYGAHIGRYQAGLALVHGKTVLDIACGSGYGSKLMAAKAKKVYGVDVDRDTIKYANEHYNAKNITYMLGDGIAIPLEDKSIDVAVSYETIEHIADYKKFLSEVKRVLKPDGLFLLSTPNDLEYAEGNHFHIHEFTYEELKVLVCKYFKYHKDYFQTLWYYSSIVPEDMQITEWGKAIDTVNTVALKPEQCIYFFLLCSNKTIKETIKPLGVIGEHFRQRSLQAREQLFKQTRKDLRNQELLTKNLNSKLIKLSNKLKQIEESKTWILARRIQKTSHRVKNITRRKK